MTAARPHRPALDKGLPSDLLDRLDEAAALTDRGEALHMLAEIRGIAERAWVDDELGDEDRLEVVSYAADLGTWLDGVVSRVGFAPLDQVAEAIAGRSPAAVLAGRLIGLHCYGQAALRGAVFSGPVAQTFDEFDRIKGAGAGLIFIRSVYPVAGKGLRS